MKINLYEIMSVVGKEITIDASLDSLEGKFQGELFCVYAKDNFQVVAKHIQKELVSVKIDVSVVVKRPCSRCLDTVSGEYELHISRDIDVVNHRAIDSNFEESMAEADEISYIEDCNLDVDMLILDELYTILPMTVLCKEDCKGICKVCGTNLNKSTCDCDQTVPDPRMAVFSDIFNQFKEV
ncbi:MAG: YceD family protein [Lachnospiraceae bacterium]